MTTRSSEPTSDKTPPDTTTGPSCDTVKTNATGSSDSVESGMKTRITVIDGMDGHTPEMLRKRPTCPDCGFLGPGAHFCPGPDKLTKAREFTQYFRDPMHD